MHLPRTLHAEYRDLVEKLKDQIPDGHLLKLIDFSDELVIWYCASHQNRERCRPLMAEIRHYRDTEISSIRLSPEPRKAFVKVLKAEGKRPGANYHFYCPLLLLLKEENFQKEISERVQSRCLVVV